MDNTLITSNIKLTIGILVSNRIQYIRKVMEGIKPLLKSLPCELIVVDTKGAEGDGSIEIVKEYTDQIYPFTWCNDFAAARNVCLEHAQGEWFLYIDDDEVFDDVTEIIHFFQSNEHNHYNSAGFYIRNYEADGAFSTSVIQRFVRRRENTRFIGAIHEHINEVFLPNKLFHCFVHHYGYAFQTLKDAQKHQERNVSILQEELKKEGYEPHLCAQMTQELIYLETSTDEGFSFAKKALQELAKLNQLTTASAQWIMYATVLYFLRKESVSEAIRQIRYLEETYPLNQITHLIFSGIQANLALSEKNISDMLLHATRYVELWDWKNAHEEEAALQTALNFPHYYEMNYYYNILHIGAAAANAQEQYRLAKKFWDRLPLGMEDFDIAPYYQDFSATIRGLKKVQLLQKNYAEYLQQTELLEQACQQVKQYFITGNLPSATEYLEVIQQFIPAVENMFLKLFEEENPVFSCLENFKKEAAVVAKHSLTESSLEALCKNASAVTTEFCQAAKTILEKNS